MQTYSNHDDTFRATFFSKAARQKPDGKAWVRGSSTIEMYSLYRKSFN